LNCARAGVIMNPKREQIMNLKYVIYREDKYYVAQCLNVDVSTFGESIQEAQQNLREAVELYFEGEGKKADYIEIEEVLLGETVLNV
jgi:predicted RNase H-like HicB family nuclease